MGRFSSFVESKAFGRVTSMALAAVTCLMVVMPSTSQASEEGDLRLGVQAGHVGLIGEVGKSDRNSIGIGGFVNYFATDEMVFEIGYTNSSHGPVTHSDLNTGINFYLANYDIAFAHLSAGVSFLHNRIDLTGSNISGDAFGLYGGGGVDFDIGRLLAVGLEARYQKAFESTARVNNVEVKTVQDSVTVMLRLAFVIPTAQ